VDTAVNAASIGGGFHQDLRDFFGGLQVHFQKQLVAERSTSINLEL
jgi:hypothetical protein